MDRYAQTDKAILNDLGSRLKTLRIRHNITQEKLAELTLLSVGTIKSMEVGKAKLSTIVSVLREMDALHELDHFIPLTTVSLLEMVSRNAKVRVRAGRNQADDASLTSQDSDW